MQFLLDEQILGVDEADDVVEILLVDGQAGEAGHRHRGDRPLDRRVDLEGLDLHPRMHDLADHAVAEAQGALGHALLGQIDHAGMVAGQDQVLDVLEGDGRLALARLAQ